jgi:hypothetical protein
VSPDQYREARDRLRWSQGECADAADVPLWFVVAFEDDDSPAFLAHYEIALREALEAVGISFAFEIEDGQFKPAGVRRSAIREETLAPLSVKNGANLVWVVFQRHAQRRRNQALVIKTAVVHALPPLL